MSKTVMMIIGDGFFFNFFFAFNEWEKREKQIKPEPNNKKKTNRKYENKTEIINLLMYQEDAL